jgi:8-oxo-dGTP pyrophosphatase MutT (NUDIX family)
MPQAIWQQVQRALLSESAVLQAVPHNLAELESFLPEAEAFAPASVLCGLVPRADGLQVLLTKRSPHLRHHPGQISFPGGRIETADANPFEAALREAHEEIGLEADYVRLLGYLDPLVTITGYRVFPAVAIVDPDYRAEPDGVEVAELFEAPLSLFLDAGNEHPFDIEFRGVMRSLKEFRWQEYRIWGATASMLINLRQRLGEMP